jgi:signal transduction histidine kinase
MFAEVCETAVHELGYRLAWVGLLREGDFDVHPVAHAGYDEGYVEAAKIMWSHGDARAEGPVGRAIRERHPCVCKNIETDPRFGPWREDAMRRGYAASVAIPLLDRGLCLGALNLYAPEPDAFDDDDEIALLEQFAIDLVLGMTRLRATTKLEELRQKLEQATGLETSDEIAAAIAHDMNNLLHIVSLAIQSAREQQRNDRDEALAEAHQTISIAAQLLKSLVSLARRSSAAGGQANVDQVLGSLRPLLCRLARHAELRVDLRAQGAIAPVSAVDLERVVINLVMNASYAVRGDGVITVSTARRHVGPGPLVTSTGQVPEGDYLEMSVADDGQGIAPDSLARIFEPFFTTRGERGSGLGLTSVLRIVRAVGGDLIVDSAVGKGSRFTALIPALPATSNTRP